MVVAVSLWLVVLGAAETAPQPRGASAAPSAAAKSANEIVCEDITVTGSRLASRRFCGTRAQWADKRLQDRQATEQFQRSVCLPGATNAKGQKSC